MKNFNLTKTFVSGLALTLASLPQAWCATNSGSACGGKCTWYYDTETKDLRVEKNADVGESEEVIISGYFSRSIAQTINNVTIGEGITGMMDSGYWPFCTYGGHSDGSASSTLKLPSTYKYTAGSGTHFWNVGFGTIDASALKDTTLSLPTAARQNIIIDANSNVRIENYGSYGSVSPAINIICKGELTKCQSMLKTNATQVTAEYYKGYDSDGRIIEEWGPDGKTEYAYKLDGAGNLTAAYKNGIATYKRTSYTPAEAAAAANRGSNNTITFTFK